MNEYIKKLIIPAIAIYAIVALYSFEIANICVLIFAMILTPAMVIKYTIKKKNKQIIQEDLKNEYLVQNNTLQNNYVIFQYIKSSYIIVKDNPNIKNASRDLRSFNVIHDKYHNVDKAWMFWLSNFDNNTTLESILPYFGSDVKIEITAKRKVLSSLNHVKKVEKAQVEKQTENVFVDINKIKKDKSNIGEEEEEKTEDKDIEDKIPESQNPQTENNKTGDVTLFNFSDLLSKSANKININTANSSEIAILPGINIAIAKKIVEHRQKNGYFKTAEDFIETAQLKDHFVEKVKNMIIVDIPQNSNEDNDDNTSNRIVD